jgi:ribonuclease HII
MLLPFLQSELIEAGCDEAGRGCLAGPVYAAAVILPKDFCNELLNDSKQLSEVNRYALREIIEKEALAFAVAKVSHAEIDKINILKASIRAMHLALQKLEIAPEFIIIKGDGKYASIAAASILAKTHRDDEMLKLHKKYPQYNWASNKGYGSAEHRAAMAEYGRCPLHRKSFVLKSEIKMKELF